jgi:hypothetical protein
MDYKTPTLCSTRSYLYATNTNYRQQQIAFAEEPPHLQLRAECPRVPHGATEGLKGLGRALAALPRPLGRHQTHEPLHAPHLVVARIVVIT